MNLRAGKKLSLTMAQAVLQVLLLALQLCGVILATLPEEREQERRGILTHQLSQKKSFDKEDG